MSGTPHDWEEHWVNMWEKTMSCRGCGARIFWKSVPRNPFGREPVAGHSGYVTGDLGGERPCPDTCEEFLLEAVHGS